MSEIGQQLIQAVRKAAAEQPDYIYQKPRGGGDDGICYYVFDGQPSCIVGRAAWNLGLINAQFEESSDNTSGVSGLAEALQLELEFDEQEWLEFAQNAQDTGHPWGSAVLTADTEVPLPVLA